MPVRRDEPYPSRDRAFLLEEQATGLGSIWQFHLSSRWVRRASPVAVSCLPLALEPGLIVVGVAAFFNAVLRAWAPEDAPGAARAA